MLRFFFVSCVPRNRIRDRLKRSLLEYLSILLIRKNLRTKFERPWRIISATSPSLPRAFLSLAKRRNKKKNLDYYHALVISVTRDNPIRARPNGICGLRCTGCLRKMSTCENRRLRICILKCSTPACRGSDRIKTQTRNRIRRVDYERRRGGHLCKRNKSSASGSKNRRYKLTY